MVRTIVTKAFPYRTQFEFFADKTVDDDDDNDVYETIEFSDSSSHVYTEPIRDYGVLRKVNIRTSSKPRAAARKPPSGMKKSAAARNLQKFSVMQDVSKAGDEENDPQVELRTKPVTPAIIDDSRDSQRQNMSLISVGLRNFNSIDRQTH